MSTPCLLTPHAYSSSSCGYCSPSGSRSDRSTSKKYGLEATQMSVQDMIDRGWRRSGDYVYRPDMARTCCPQYTIRLDALAFKPNKKHRQVMNRFNRYLETGVKPGEAEHTEGTSAKQQTGKPKGKGKAKDESWLQTLHTYQQGSVTDEAGHQHSFETELVPAKATAETFELYEQYQIAVHNDKPDKVSMRGFSRFLCDSPLGNQAIKYSDPGAKSRYLPEHYGSYHLLYKVDGNLIGISVIDILPSCVSSVYFIWHPKWAWASLGKLSALHEIALAVEINKSGVEGMKYLYMGYWISNCVKMRYKSEYSPSYLLDPGTLRFHLLDTKLDKYLQARPTGYHPFADMPAVDGETKSPTDTPVDTDGAHSDEDADQDSDDDMEQLDEFPWPPPPGFTDLTSITQKQLDELIVLMKSRGRSRIIALGALAFVNPDSVHKIVHEMVSAVGPDLMASGTSLDKMKNKGIVFFG